MSKEKYSTPKSQNISNNSQQKFSQSNSSQLQSNRSPISLLTNLQEITIETYDKQVPFISLFKPDTKKQLSKTQGIISMNKLIMQKRISLFRSAFVNFKGLKQYQTKISAIVGKISRVVNNVQRNNNKNIFYTLKAFKRYKLNGLIATKLIKNLFNRKYNNFMTTSMNKLQFNGLIYELEVSRNENKLALQLNTQKKQIFQLKFGLFSLQFITKIKPLQKYMDSQSFINDLTTNDFQNELKMQINRFQDLRSKSNPKRKDPLDNQIVINVTGSLLKAFFSYINIYETQVNQLNNQLLSYKDVQGINQLSQRLTIKQSELSKFQQFLNQLIRLDTQIKRISLDQSQFTKLSSLLKTHINKMQPRAKKFQDKILKVYTSRSFFYQIITVIIQAYKKLSQESNLILKRIVYEYKQPEQILVFIKQNYGKTYYQELIQLLVNQYNSLKEYEVSNGQFSKLNQELQKKVNTSTSEVEKLKKQVTQLQTQKKDIENQNGRYKEEMQARITKFKEQLQAKTKEIKVLKPLEKRISNLQAQNNRLKGINQLLEEQHVYKIQRMREQHEKQCILIKEQMYQYKNKLFSCEQTIRIFEQNQEKNAQETKWLRNRLKLLEPQRKTIIKEQLPENEDEDDQNQSQTQKEKSKQKQRLKRQKQQLQKQKLIFQKQKEFNHKLLQQKQKNEILQKQKQLEYRLKQQKEIKQISHLQQQLQQKLKYQKQRNEKFQKQKQIHDKFQHQKQIVDKLQKQRAKSDRLQKQLHDLLHKQRQRNERLQKQRELHDKSQKQREKSDRQQREKERYEIIEKQKEIYFRLQLEKQRNAKLQVELKKFQDFKENLRKTQQKLIKYESLEQMLRFKIETLQTQRQRFFKTKKTSINSQINHHLHDKDFTLLQDTIKRLQNQKQMLQFKYKVLETDRQRYIKAEQRIQSLQGQIVQKLKLQDKIKQLLSQKQLIIYKCIILQSDRDRLLAAQQKIKYLQQQRQNRVKAQQRVRQLQRQKEMIQFKMEMMASSPFKSLTKRQEEHILIQHRQRQRDKDRGYHLLQEKIRVLLEEKEQLQRKLRQIQHKYLQEQSSYSWTKDKTQKTQQYIKLIWNDRIQQITQKNHKIQLQLQLKLKDISFLTQQNLQKQKKIQQLYLKHLQSLDELSNYKINYQQHNRSYSKQIQSLQSQLTSYKTIITTIQEDNTKKEIQILSLNEKTRNLEELAVKDRFLVQDLKERLRVSQERYMQEKNRKVNEYLSQTQNLKKEYEYIVRQYKLKMQKLQLVQRQLQTVERKYQDTLRLSNDLRAQLQHLKIKTLTQKTQYDALSSQKQHLTKFISQLQLKISQSDDSTIHLKSQINQLKSQFFKTSLELQSYSTSRLYSDNRELSIKRQLKQRQIAIETILQQSRTQNQELMRQLYMMKQEIQNNRRQYQLQLNQRHNNILKLEYQITSKESTIKSLENLIILSDHLTQNANKDQELLCKNQEIQLLNKQILTLQQFISQITTEYQSLESKYHQERYHNNKNHIQFQNMHKSQVTEVKRQGDSNGVKDTFSVAGSEGHSGQASGENWRQNFGQKYSEIFEPVSKMNLSADAEQLFKKIILNNQTLSDVMNQLRQQNTELHQKLKNSYHKQWIIQLIFNIIAHALALDRHSQRGSQIMNDLNKLTTLNSQQFFVYLQQYCKTTIPTVSTPNADNSR